MKLLNWLKSLDPSEMDAFRTYLKGSIGVDNHVYWLVVELKKDYPDFKDVDGIKDQLKKKIQRKFKLEGFESHNLNVLSNRVLKILKEFIQQRE
ncbi:MAG: hypothetical protein AAF598_05955, partial [Bacteroidota bacterium]